MTTGTSPQGISYAVRRSGRAVAFCALTIGCGTRDEGSYPAGIAHFTEHTLFRGTRRKSAAVISGYLDKLGGELNAYTTKEEIVLHATVLKEDWKKAVRLLLELATEATFPEDEVETERGVVLDEIISYKDNPAEDVYDRFESLLFEGSPLSTPILGSCASVKKLLRKCSAASSRRNSSPPGWFFPWWPISTNPPLKNNCCIYSLRRAMPLRSLERRPMLPQGHCPSVRNPSTR